MALGASGEVAEGHFRRALELEPGGCEAAAALVSVLQQRGDRAGAAQVLLEQLVRRPSDFLYLHLGHVRWCGPAALTFCSRALAWPVGKRAAPRARRLPRALHGALPHAGRPATSTRQRKRTKPALA